jgi:hypothetical protein
MMAMELFKTIRIKEARSAMYEQKLAAAVSAATTGSGLATILNLLPNNIGEVATFVGIILSLLLIRVHFVSLQKQKFELEVMKRKEAERVAALGRRQEERRQFERKS